MRITYFHSEFRNCFVITKPHYEESANELFSGRLILLKIFKLGLPHFFFSSNDSTATAKTEIVSKTLCIVL